MGHFLNFGPGPNQLPEPWQNLDPSHDIRKRLRFENDSATGILAEHVIEHVPFLQALRFFQECLRVLEPSGVLRVAFPDVGRFVCPTGPSFDDSALNARAVDYAERLAARPGMEYLGDLRPLEKARAAMFQILTGWGHQMAWGAATATGCLLAVGFKHVHAREYGKGDIAGVDGHHRDVGAELAKLESTILEAVK